MTAHNVCVTLLTKENKTIDCVLCVIQSPPNVTEASLFYNKIPEL